MSVSHTSSTQSMTALSVSKVTPLKHDPICLCTTGRGSPRALDVKYLTLFRLVNLAAVRTLERAERPAIVKEKCQSFRPCS